ncbi:MAG: hypothetical protein KA257_03840 [Opitutaceae bacterium]|nr:hypothetical protein [Opitutaceae bacterium]MBP9913898.1 hypothetical protein [Opitutaceae bacterium]
MNKKLRLVLIVLLGIAVLVYIGFTFFLGSIVRSGVVNFGPKLTQTKVELAEANISPLSGKGSLRGLSVGNPKGWSAEKAFYLGRVQVDMQPFSLFGDYIVINEIIIDQPEFNYETKIISSNIKELLKNIEEFTGSGGKEATTKSGKPIKFVVKKFRITNGKATLGVGPAALPLPLPPLSLDNLGVKEGGITPDQLVTAMMKNVLGSIVEATGKAALQVGSTTGAAAADAAANTAKKAGDGLKKLFGK